MPLFGLFLSIASADRFLPSKSAFLSYLHALVYNKKYRPPLPPTIDSRRYDDDDQLIDEVFCWIKDGEAITLLAPSLLERRRLKSGFFPSPIKALFAFFRMEQQ